jgi:hypothetical protein
MILKCAYCSGQMRVDESRIPQGKRVRIRCPHCDGIGLTSLDPPSGDSVGAVPAAAELKDRGALSPLSGQEERGSSRVPGKGPEVSEPAVPAYAFNGFRFPSEVETGRPAKRSWGPRTRIAAWVGASLGIVLVFALIVNLVLPGPPR